jgi:hypothetical protein
MTPTLRMRIPPANTDRPSNGAIQNSGLPATRPARFVREATTPRPSNKKPSQDLSIYFQAQNPTHARAGFCFFMDGMLSAADQFGKLLDGTCWNTSAAKVTAPLPPMRQRTIPSYELENLTIEPRS